MSKRVSFITDADMDTLLNFLQGLAVTELNIEEVNINSKQGAKL